MSPVQEERDIRCGLFNTHRQVCCNICFVFAKGMYAHDILIGDENNFHKSCIVGSVGAEG